ncbi:MAG: hypothetical protein ACE5GN_03815, partial [Waddliaceae bacterium]
MRDMEGHLIFPGFVTAFDLEAMKTLIKEALSKDNTQLQVTKCEIADVKYEPRKKCVLLYKTKIQDESAGKTWEQFVTGILLQKNEVYAAGHEKEIFLKDQKIILLPFPYDHILSWLPDMYHEDSVKTLLCRSRPKHSLIPSKVNTSLLIYKPQMRATFQYEIFAENRKTGATDWHHWIAKTNVFRSSKRVFANYWALWKASKGKI